MQLKREFGLPWVADFRDLWTQQDGKYNRFTDRERRMEEDVIREADWITIVTDIGLETLTEKYPEIAVKSSTISHGFDPDDYRGLKLQDYDDWCTFTYAGTLYGNRTEGTTGFLEALKVVVDRKPEIKVKVQFIGRCDAVKGDVKRLGLGDRVTFIPWLSKRAVLERLVMSSVQLFILGDSLVDRNASTGKIFDYMGVGRPVMAVVPEGVAERMVRETGIGTVDRPSDVEGMAKRIEYWTNGWQFRPVASEIAKYSIEGKAREMAEVLERIVK